MYKSHKLRKVYHGRCQAVFRFVFLEGLFSLRFCWGRFPVPLQPGVYSLPFALAGLSHPLPRAALRPPQTQTPAPALPGQIPQDKPAFPPPRRKRPNTAAL
jgi:hypothetical protein